MIIISKDFPGGSDGKAPIYNVGGPGLSPGLGRSPGEGNGNPLQYYCLENPMDRGAWQAAVYGVAKSRIWGHKEPDTTERLHFISLHFTSILTSAYWLDEYAFFFPTLCLVLFSQSNSGVYTRATNNSHFFFFFLLKSRI